MIKDKQKKNKATVNPWFKQENFISKGMIVNWDSMTVLVNNKKGSSKK